VFGIAKSGLYNATVLGRAAFTLQTGIADSFSGECLDASRDLLDATCKLILVHRGTPDGY